MEDTAPLGTNLACATCGNPRDRFIVYARVSTTDQDLALQREGCWGRRRECRLRGESERQRAWNRLGRSIRDLINIAHETSRASTRRVKEALPWSPAATAGVESFGLNVSYYFSGADLRSGSNWSLKPAVTAQPSM
jgi:hypothetical protein